MIKIWTILKSRFIRDKNEDWVKERREVCRNCRTYNSLHYKEKTSLKNRVYKILSDFYTFITFAENEDLGQCLHPECGCPTFFSTLSSESSCPDNKWKSIYIPNK